MGPARRSGPSLVAAPGMRRISSDGPREPSRLGSRVPPSSRDPSRPRPPGAGGEPGGPVRGGGARGPIGPPQRRPPDRAPRDGDPGRGAVATGGRGPVRRRPSTTAAALTPAGARGAVPRPPASADRAALTSRPRAAAGWRRLRPGEAPRLRRAPATCAVVARRSSWPACRARQGPEGVRGGELRGVVAGLAPGRRAARTAARGPGLRMAVRRSASPGGSLGRARDGEPGARAASAWAPSSRRPDPRVGPRRASVAGKPPGRG